MALTMPTAQEFADYIGVPLDEPFLQSSLATAGALVDQFIESAWREVPQDVYKNEVLRTAHAVNQQSKAGSGSAQVVQVGDTAVFKPNDPLSQSYSTLRKYVLPF